MNLAVLRRVMLSASFLVLASCAPEAVRIHGNMESALKNGDSKRLQKIVAGADQSLARSQLANFIAAVVENDDVKGMLTLENAGYLDISSRTIALVDEVAEEMERGGYLHVPAGFSLLTAAINGGFSSLPNGYRYRENSRPIAPAYSIVRELVGRGVDLNMANENGMFPLDYAYIQGDERIIRPLVEHGARATGFDSLGNGNSWIQKYFSNRERELQRLAEGRARVDRMEVQNREEMKVAIAQGIADISAKIASGAQMVQAAQQQSVAAQRGQTSAQVLEPGARESAQWTGPAAKAPDCGPNACLQCPNPSDPTTWYCEPKNGRSCAMCSH